MSAVKILTETDDTVTVSREDWLQMLAALDDAEDRAAVTARRANEHAMGEKAARRNYLATAEAKRLLDGESPVKVWREKRGLSQRALAEQAGVANSYIAEIETSRKPGSGDAYRKLAAALGVASEDLDGRRYRTRDPSYGPVVLRSVPVSAGVSPGNRGAWGDRMDFPTLGDALEFVREQWASLRPRSPWIANVNYWPIYDADDLIREIEG